MESFDLLQTFEEAVSVDADPCCHHKPRIRLHEQHEAPVGYSS